MIFALSAWPVLLTIVVCANAADVFKTYPRNYNNYIETDDRDTELVLAFVMFRHGDRTPDPEELILYPDKDFSRKLYPFGPKSLTNKGKQRGFLVGDYLRRRYDGLISRLYLPEEIVLRTTDYDRTKMTALTAMAALYMPVAAQKWNPELNWQPVPYDTVPYDEDDLLYWYNCPRYLWLRDQAYEIPEVKERIAPYKPFFEYLSEKTNGHITKPEDVFFLSNLFQTMINVGIPVPQWALDVSDKINELTTLEYEVEYYTPELIRLASGILLEEIRNVSSEWVAGLNDGPKLRLYSAHENNVAGLMAAVTAFEPHQPPYGSTFSLELRRTRDGEYGMMAVYAMDPTEQGRVIPMQGCKGRLFCNLELFLEFTKNHTCNQTEFKKQCPVTMNRKL